MSDTVVIVGENSTHADTLFCWLSNDAAEGDAEGIIAVQSPDGFGWTPLVFATERLARAMEPQARTVVDILRAHGQRVTARLVRFERGAMLREI